jgi:hypothetical protein
MALSKATSDKPAFPWQAVLLALALLLLYAGIMAVKLALWHDNVLMNDWAFYSNMFWNTDFSHHWLFSHDRYVQFGYPSYLNEHFAPLLLVIAALYQLIPTPELMLLALHGASPILAAIFIYLTAARLLKDRTLSAMIALTYALSPGILWPTISMIYGSQPDGMLPPLAAMIGWALATNRTAAYFVAFVLALSIKENVPAYGVILGGCLILFTSHKRLALWTIALSVAVFLIASKGVPAITGVQNRNVGVAWHFIDDLLHFRATSDYTLPQIAIGLAYGVVFLPALFVWPFLAMIGPDLLLIGQVSYANTITWHAMLPVTVLGSASVFGTIRILSTRVWPAWLDRRVPRPLLLQRYWAAMLCLSLVAGSATILIAYHRYDALRSPVDQAAVAQARAMVPPDAGVVTTGDLEQYFTRRRVLTARADVLQRASREFSYFVLNRRSLTPARIDGPLAASTRQDACFITTADRAIADGRAQKLMDQAGILVVHFDQLPPLNCR